MHLTHFLWSNDPGAVLVFLPLYTARLQMPKILKTSIHKGYIQDPVKPQNASKVSEVIIPQIFCSLFSRVIEDIEIELGCLSFPCLISLLLKDHKLGHLTSTTWCSVTPLTWLFLFQFNFVKSRKSPSVYLFVRLPHNFHSWHSRDLPAPHVPVGPNSH